MVYTHDFETMSKTTAYRNHIMNSEIETREVSDRETKKFPLTRSTDSSKHEERQEPEVNLDPGPSSFDSSEILPLKFFIV